MSTPIHRLRYGNISVAIWLNQTSKGVFYNCTARRSYKDDEGEWQDSDSFSDMDLPALAKAAFDAHSWIHEQKRQATITLVNDGDSES